MDFRLDTEHEAFLRTLRSYLDGLETAEVARQFELDPEAIVGSPREFVKRLGADGWLGIGWPVEHGGKGASAVCQWLFLEEMSYRGLPVGNLTTSSVGPAIARVGSDEQRAEFLPRILSGELDFAIGYTEPDSGTDLACLQTRARRDGDTYVINGQKVYTTGAHVATHIWLAARTGAPDSRHHGISLLIVPTDTAGITIRPLITQADWRTNEVFFDEVQVPVTALLGAENEGWAAITTQLNFERLFAYSHLHREFDDLVEWLDGAELIPTTRAYADVALAELAADIEAARLLSMRAAWMIDQGETPYVEASMAKVWYSELRQRIAIVGLDLVGVEGQIAYTDPASPLRGRLEREYRCSPTMKFGAGTNEMQRNVIAQRGLGLPR